MNSSKYYLPFAMVVMLFFCTSTLTFAASSASPQVGAGGNGLKVQGDASGTKLSGVLEISFNKLECLDAFLGSDIGSAENPQTDCTYLYPDTTVECPGTPNAASARVALRLSFPNANNKGEMATKTFYVDIDYTDDLLSGDDPFNHVLTEGKVPYWDLPLLQDIVLTQLKEDILAFVGLKTGEIYLKDFSLYSYSDLSPPNDNLGDDPNLLFCDPPSCHDDPYSEECTRSSYLDFAVVADVILAVK